MMTNAEHLIENAVTALESHDPYDAYSIFMYNPCNAEMAALAGVSLDVVWEMAQYCYTTLRTEWQGDNQSSFRWIPVTERLPEAKVDVLAVIHYKDGRTAVNQGWYSALNEQWYIGVAGIHAPVTHWMSLPYAPEEGHDA
jgi:hypothetical protein